MRSRHLLFPTELSSLVIACYRDKPSLRSAEHGHAERTAPAGISRARTRGRAKDAAYASNSDAKQVFFVDLKHSCERSVAQRPVSARASASTSVARQLSNKTASADDRIVRGWPRRLVLSIAVAERSMAGRAGWQEFDDMSP